MIEQLYYLYNLTRTFPSNICIFILKRKITNQTDVKKLVILVKTSQYSIFTQQLMQLIFFLDYHKPIILPEAILAITYLNNEIGSCQVEYRDHRIQ